MAFNTVTITNLDNVAVLVRTRLDEKYRGLRNDAGVKFDFYTPIKEYSFFNEKRKALYLSKETKGYKLMFADINVVDEIYKAMCKKYEDGSLSNNDIKIAIQQINAVRYFIKK